MATSVHLLPLLLLLQQTDTANTSGPSFLHSSRSYNLATVGEEVLLACLVQNQGNFSVIWKKVNSNKSDNDILTVNSDKVTEDKRFSVLHESGGEVFGLQIANVTTEDTGIFLCEVNTDPVLTSFHQLTVSEAPEQGLNNSYQETLDHQFTSCCLARNVSTACQQLCSLKTIIAGRPDVHQLDCKAEYADILSCIADGRNHMPCCIDAGIPQACTPMCRGEAQLQTDNIKTMFSCSAYNEPILACVAAGIKTLPKTPEDFSAEALDDSSIHVKWSPAKNYENLTEYYKINVTFLRALSPVFSVSQIRGEELDPSHSVVYKLPRDKDVFTFTGLRPFSLYTVSMWAENRMGGRSLPTYAVKVITHMQGQSRESSGSLLASSDLQLPDVRSCCIQNNVSNTMCLDSFCDPHKVTEVSTHDLMKCAPWDTEMFRCLADGKDHSPCCSERRVPPLCQELCSGTDLNITFEYFSCLAYMSDISSCMLEGYNVLPSNPVNFRISNIHSDFVVLHWNKPEQLGDTVIDYVVTLKKLKLVDGDYEDEFTQILAQTIVEHAHSPFIVENLDNDSSYEVFVKPVNVHGVGESSTGIAFRTSSIVISDFSENPPPYDPSSCCLKAGIKPECSALCSFNANMSVVLNLSNTCRDDFSKLVRCTAAGRDHLSCCARRGISDSCLPLCQAVHQTSTGADFQKCLPQIGEIFICYEEGSVHLPPPVWDFKAVTVKNGMVVLSWASDSSQKEANLLQFEVFYKKMRKDEFATTVFDNNQHVNTTVPVVKIDGLEIGSLYRFFVVSRNQKGSSLPSSIITLNVSAAAWQGIPIPGATSPPHILSLNSRSPTGLKFSWNPPAISHPEDLLQYRIYFQNNLIPNSELQMVDTDVTSISLKDLKPSTLYLVYATTITVHEGTSIESSRSEELMAWTDMVEPAVVETPTIEPAELNVGTNMTVTCIAMGTPLPTVTLYINGHRIRSETTHHMVTMVHNVTSEMDHVSCFADNGYGTPMIASKKTNVNRVPHLLGPDLTMAVIGDTMNMECIVVAFPAPVMAIFRDEELTHSLGDGDRVRIVGRGDEEDYSKFYLSLTIHNISAHDAGDYYCHANNTLGQENVKMQLQLTSPPSNVTQCCSSKNVSMECIDSCQGSVDLDFVLAKPSCIQQLEPILSCTQDGSEVTSCCSSAGVPAHCLGWCHGHAGQVGDACGLVHARSIVDCFHDSLVDKPDVPVKLEVAFENSNTVTIHWDEPTSNAKLYRVFWKAVDDKETNIIESKVNSITLNNLKSGMDYVVNVKAANSNQFSKLSKDLKFVVPEKLSADVSPLKSEVQITIAVILAALSVLGLIVLAWIVRKKKIVFVKMKDEVDTTVAFENPAFTSQDMNMETQSREDNIHIRSLQDGQITQRGSGS